ncbi:MAG: hypothetical protein ACXVO1_09280 [Tumebacillaceae bacterium]
MLTFLLIVAAAYLFYNWGVRLHLRSQLSQQAWLDVCGYACSMTAGTLVALYLTLNVFAPYYPQASTYMVSAVSTLLSVLFGEFLYGRSNRLSLRLLAPLRSKEQESAKRF